MGILTYVSRVKKIYANENVSEYFTPKELIMATVNLLDAKKFLSSYEYYYVATVFDTYKKMTFKIKLNKKEFLHTCFGIMAHLDLIAPYYKISGDKNMFISFLVEEDKQPYREKAKQLLMNDMLFSDEWMALHSEFMKEFYSMFL